MPAKLMMNWLQSSFLIFLLLGCESLDAVNSGETKMLSGKILHASTSIPLSNSAVVLYRLKKPLLSMRGWVVIGKTETDDRGFFEFEITEKGPYEIRWNPESRIVSYEKRIENFTGERFIKIEFESKSKRKLEDFPWFKK